MIFRSRHPLGPYEEPPPGINPLVHNSPDDPHVRQTGHADLVQAEDGRWWGVLLATRRQLGDTEQVGRETFLVPVDWPEGGWPVFNKGQPVGLTVLSNDLPRANRVGEWRDDFSICKSVGLAFDAEADFKQHWISNGTTFAPLFGSAILWSRAD